MKLGLQGSHLQLATVLATNVLVAKENLGKLLQISQS
jgi:hypothetical protein